MGLISIACYAQTCFFGFDGEKPRGGQVLGEEIFLGRGKIGVPGDKSRREKKEARGWGMGGRSFGNPKT